jgi:hypothetical protein
MSGLRAHWALFKGSFMAWVMKPKNNNHEQQLTD